MGCNHGWRTYLRQTVDRKKPRSGHALAKMTGLKHGVDRNGRKSRQGVDSQAGRFTTMKR